MYILAAGMDYMTTTFTVTFEPSADGQRQCGNVPIINDDLGNEGDELFSVVITNTSIPSVMIGPMAESCVTILDDDSKHKVKYVYHLNAMKYAVHSN